MKHLTCLNSYLMVNGIYLVNHLLQSTLFRFHLLFFIEETSRDVFEQSYGEDTYRALSYIFKLRRRTLYYGFNMILPSIFYSLMTLLGFALPVECNEKITLGTHVWNTILLNIKC